MLLFAHNAGTLYSILNSDVKGRGEIPMGVTRAWVRNSVGMLKSATVGLQIIRYKTKTVPVRSIASVKGDYSCMHSTEWWHHRSL